MNHGVECHVFLTDISLTICVRKRKDRKKKRKKERKEVHLNSEDDLTIFQLSEYLKLEM